MRNSRDVSTWGVEFIGGREDGTIGTIAMLADMMKSPAKARRGGYYDYPREDAPAHGVLESRWMYLMSKSDESNPADAWKRT